ncbi:hypothetical protein [Methylobacterium oryzihabitans]|uniref:Uncharacterized protein n=1 Tax=Methylobacterium oryzihabitans TaxID=2499852 RepID=A0A437PA89_9HYPH|nr:hypothetical protein [Methylobacterium oryzihabitans]RVU19131.1 hypothetical protein EOE48_09590 [Methylobacterium oryzihabitans]
MLTDTVSATPTTVTRRRSSKYPPTTREALTATLALYNQAVGHLQDPEGHPAPDLGLAQAGLPQGSISAISIAAPHPLYGPVLDFRIGERNPRQAPASGILILRGLSLFGGVPFIDTNKKGGREQHYVEVLAEGFTLQRLMAGAEVGQSVRLLGDHHDLTPWCLSVETDSPRAKRTRAGAIALALKLYDRNARDWGLSDLLSREEYEAFLRGAFRLFDAEHGRHLLRPVGLTAG